MTLIADITLNQLKVLTMSTGSILSYINATKIFLYYVNKGPVIFRVTLKRDKNAFLFIQSLPPRIELRSELGKEIAPIEMSQPKKESDPVVQNIPKKPEIDIEALRKQSTTSLKR